MGSPLLCCARRGESRWPLGQAKRHSCLYFWALQLTTLRGAILEDATPTTTKHGTVRGIPLKDVLEHVVPELNMHCLRLALSVPQVCEQLRKLDEQGVSTTGATWVVVEGFPTCPSTLPVAQEGPVLSQSPLPKSHWEP